MRPIQCYLKRNWRIPESLEKEIPVPSSLHPHFRWWTKAENVLPGQPLQPMCHAIQVFTDASKEGWGAHLGDCTANGTWSLPESRLHINFLELKAVLLAFKKFQHLVENQVILIATYNTTVVAYINKEGGMRSGSLCTLLWRLLSWCNLRHISQTHPRPSECDCGQSVPTESDNPDAMVTSPGVRPLVSNLAQSSGRHVCDQIQLQTDQVRVPSPGCLGSGCFNSTLGRSGHVRIPPVSLLGKVTSKLSDHLYQRVILIAQAGPTCHGSGT